MMRLVTLAAPLLLGGCAIGTGIVPVGPGVYATSAMRAPVRGGGDEARRVVLDAARGFCAQQGATPAFLDMRPGGDPFTPYWPTAFNATFRCVTRPAGAAPAPQAR